MNNHRHLRLPLAICMAVALGGGVVIAPLAQEARQQNSEPRVLPAARIDWATVARVYNPDVAAKAKGSRGISSRAEQLDATTLPILLPDASTGVSRSGLLFSSLGDVYDVNLPQPVKGLTVLLSGTRVFVAAQPGMNQRKYEQITMGGQQVEVLFSRMEDGWLATFSRFGVSYDVEVTCGEQPALSYCDNDSYIRKVTAGMTEVVLGARAEREMIAAVNGNRKTPSTPLNRAVKP